jgi:uncharacterized protein with NRDE domain
MCLIAIAWRVQGKFPLVVAANRDEWRERPTARLHWWNDELAHADTDHLLEVTCEYSRSQASVRTGILAGRDLKDGGTWMGVTASGRFSALTNFRDPRSMKPGAPSRGALVREFLEGHASPCEYSQWLTERMPDFNGFNLLVGDRDELWWVSNRGCAPMALMPGIHGLSNGVLNEPWPKVARAKARMGEAAERDFDETLLWDLLADDAAAPDEELPDTGIGIDGERRLSPALIRGDKYGTRSSAILKMKSDGSLRFSERLAGP